jgi:hypothetical protein
MEIRVTIGGDGNAKVETMSALEDLWHDFQFFKGQALECDEPTRTPMDHLIAKRYRRAALMALIVYLEGVLNHWLGSLLSESDLSKIDRKPLEVKIAAIQKHLNLGTGSRPAFVEARRLRNLLVHLKPGADGELYDKITQELLDSTEASVSEWLTDVERLLGVQRHPNTEAESRELRGALGTTLPGTEGYTGPKGQ